MRRAIWYLAAGLLLAAPLKAQEPVDSGPPQFRCDTTTGTVDRIVAVVGDSPILASQVEEEIFKIGRAHV